MPYVSTPDLPRVLLDLDGVLVDFVGGICKAHNVDVPYLDGQENTYYIEDLLGLSKKQFWEPANDARFWENLEWTPDGKYILESILRVFPSHSICILSSPSLAPEAAAGKMYWIQREVPDFSRRFLIGPAKEFCAHNGAFLIDDSDHNVDLFKETGGDGILVPRLWNRNWMLADNAAGFVKFYLEGRFGIRPEGV